MVQLQTINKVLSTQDSSLITLNNLSEDYFSDYKDEFNYIKCHLDKYGKIPDVETFLDVFTNFEIIKVNESDNFLLEELMKDKNKRFLAENFNKIRNLIMEDKVEDAMQILKQASEQSSSAVSLQCVDILKDTSRYELYLDKIDNYDKYFIKTGFSELDKIIGGWDVKEEIATIVARTGVGKSWLLLKCAAAAALHGKRVGIYSGEMSEDKVGYRIDTLIGHISNGALIHGNASIKNEYKRYLEETLKTVPGSIQVLTPKMINGPAGVSALRAFVEKYNIEILFIDQHSLLDDDRKAKNPFDKASNISKDLKLLQTVKQLPLICVSQQNRTKVEDKNFDPTQIALADRIGQDSTTIIFIDRDKDLFKLYLVKARDNTSGKIISYMVDLNTGVFQFVNEGAEENNSESNSQEFNGYSQDEVF